jgi:hypothetical protein
MRAFAQHINNLGLARDVVTSATNGAFIRAGDVPVAVGAPLVTLPEV